MRYFRLRILILIVLLDSTELMELMWRMYKSSLYRSVSFI